MAQRPAGHFHAAGLAAMSYGGLDRDTLKAFISALNANTSAIALYDADDRLVYASDAFARMFLRGLSGPVAFADIIRHGFRSGFGVKIDSGDVECFLGDVLVRRRQHRQRGFQTDLVDGTWLWMTETLLDDGYFLSVGTDITQLKQNERQLLQARDSAMLESLTDALTGLPNRRSLMNHLRQAAEECRTGSRHWALALVDIDRFKAINDAHGHDVGDHVLRSFAQFCTQGLRAHDRFGRFGGEEFLLLLPGLSPADAKCYLDDLRERIPAVPLDGAGGALRYTFSAGIAEMGPLDDVNECLRWADRALYQAKSAGRNRVEIA